MPPWLLITPSSRGIGFALTRHLLKTTDSSIPLVATARTKDAEGLREQLLDGLYSKDQSAEREKAEKRLDLRGGVDFDGESSFFSPSQGLPSCWSRKLLGRCNCLLITKCMADEKTIEDVAGYCKDRYNDIEKDPNAHLRLAFCIPGTFLNLLTTAIHLAIKPNY